MTTIKMKSMKKQLLEQFNSALKNTQYELTSKMEKVIKKAIKRIARQTKKQLKKKNNTEKS